MDIMDTQMIAISLFTSPPCICVIQIQVQPFWCSCLPLHAVFGEEGFYFMLPANFIGSHESFVQSCSNQANDAALANGKNSSLLGDYIVPTCNQTATAASNKVEFTIPLGFESDVDLTAAEFSTTEIFLRLCGCICSGDSAALSPTRVASSSRLGFFRVPCLRLMEGFHAKPKLSNSWIRRGVICHVFPSSCNLY
jgi:hypothetical protein